MSDLKFPVLEKKPRLLASEDVDAFAKRVGWIDDIAVITSETSYVTAQPLSWWAGVELITAYDPSWQEKHGSENSTGVWLLDQQLYRLDGTSPPIHTMNAKKPPTLDEKNVLNYIKFFCYFVRGEEGPFAILESAQDSIFPEDAPEDMLLQLPRSTQLLKQDEKGFHCEALIWYAENLFLANFLVRENGMVEMIDDEPLVGGLGVACKTNLTFFN